MDLKWAGALIGFFGGFWFRITYLYYIQGYGANSFLAALIEAALIYAPIGAFVGYLYEREQRKESPRKQKIIVKEITKKNKVNLTPWITALFIGLFVALYAYTYLGSVLFVVLSVVVYALWAQANPKIKGRSILIIDGFWVGLCGIIIPAVIRKILKSYDSWFA